MTDRDTRAAVRHFRREGYSKRQAMNLAQGFHADWTQPRCGYVWGEFVCTLPKHEGGHRLSPDGFDQ